MIARLEAMIENNQAKADANLWEMREEIRSGKELLKEEMLAKSDAHHKRMIARTDSHGFGGKSRRNSIRGRA
jgi:hypothetical protein